MQNEMTAAEQGGCRWCIEGAPEWSYDAKVWIHRRPTLDKRCLNPPNDYGYTRQVPEETKSRRPHADSN